MKYNIEEVGKKTKLHDMKIYEMRAVKNWTKHQDRLFADYDFPKLSTDKLIEWFNIKTRKSRALISVCSLDNELIGYISLRDINKFFKTSELGIVLNPQKIDKGYGSDAIATFVKWYFEKLKYKKLYLSVAMYNNRAYKVYQKLGFKEKYIFWSEFLNREINPLTDENYKNIKQYFKKQKNIIYTQCIKMELSKK